MSDAVDQREQKQREIARLAADLDLGRRYYEYCDAHSDRRKPKAPLVADCERAVAETGLAFKYHKRDRFFGYRETYRGAEFELNMQLELAMAEVIFGLYTPHGGIGGPFHLLAAEAEDLRHPGRPPRDPAYPRLPFVTYEDLREVLAFAIGLYKELRDAAAARDWS